MTAARITLNEDDPLMTPGEVATSLRVDPKTVTRWADSGKLGTPVRTPGGHRRYHRSAVEAVLGGYQLLLPAESIALNVARTQIERGDSPPYNTAAMLVHALDRLTGRSDWTGQP